MRLAETSASFVGSEVEWFDVRIQERATRSAGAAVLAITIDVTLQVSDLGAAMKLVGYLRVSTERQAEEGFGLDVQKRSMSAWARSHGNRIVLWCSDEGISGSNGLDQRIGLHDALTALRERRTSGVVVARLDRLARDLVLQEQLLAEVRRLGGDVFSTSAGEAAFLTDDPDDPSRRLIRQVLGAVNEYERAMIRLRLSAGRRRKAELGGYAYGSPPFGYRAEGGALVPEADEQVTVNRICELRRDGATLRMIVATLESEGLAPRRGEHWHPATVARILRRPVVTLRARPSPVRTSQTPNGVKSQEGVFETSRASAGR